jgi:protein-S-isoprenylcysteine O-methyltransferase Ste14
MKQTGNWLLGVRPPAISKWLLALALAAHWLIPSGRAVVYTAPALAAGAGLAGFGIMLWAWWLFRKAETPICPTAESSVLVTTGIYRLSRNPMYLGIVLMMAAAALWFGTLPFYLVTLAYFLVMDRVFCPFEEEKLALTFGAAFENYCRRARRWI